MDEITKEFVIESNEGLDRIDQDLVALERDPHNQELLAAIFRCIHTIKGTCGFLGFSNLEAVTHVGENVLSKMRDGHINLSPALTNVLLAMVDAVRGMIVNIENEGQDGERDHSDLIAALSKVLDEPTANDAISANDQAPSHKRVKVPLKSAENNAPRRFDAVPAPGQDKPVQSAPAVSTPKNAGETSIRVGVDLLDHLMNLVGELVLTRNQVLQSAADTTLAASAQSLNLITTELQEAVMKTRMQPIANITGKFPRIVRDLALSCGKKITITMDGTETEVDKTLIEAIKDPLTHILRNAVDHGIESPQTRLANGKAAEGRIVLRAFHESGQVNICISDDGGGIDPQRLLAKAVERNIVTADQAAQMSEREAINLIFNAGFSTAQQVTNVSGRGVGMDVVKTNVERIGGSIDIQSALGRSTKLTLKIPLTLAIIPALIVTSGEDRFAIPQISLLELVRLEGGDARTKIEDIRGAPVYRLRGHLLPLLFLERELSGDTRVSYTGAMQRLQSAGVLNIVVLQADDRPFGLVIDDVRDTAEIVVKPLGKLIQNISMYAGATIMGDGRVALILDVLGLAQRANLVSEIKDRTGAEKEHAQVDVDRHQESWLLFKCVDAGRMAIPLSIVARLEKISKQRMERVGMQDVVQYRGNILPLIDIAARLGQPRSAGTDDLQVVVCIINERTYGLVVDHIIDIVNASVSVERNSGRTGIHGTAVIQGRVTEFVDVETVVGASTSLAKEKAA